MIDHTRFSHDQRVAVALSNFQEGYANITLVYFPGSYAGLKRKTVLSRTGEGVGEKGRKIAVSNRSTFLYETQYAKPYVAIIKR